jgi:ABC-type polysaccharide/polyol phosphate export permease
VGTCLRDLWHARELILTLAEREMRARYKQAMLGLAWAILTPIALMLVFTLFFERVAKVNTGGSPYPVFAYLGLLPWTFFSTSVSQGGLSLVQNLSLLNRVYFPREVFPIAGMLVAGFATTVSSMVLVLLFLIYGISPKVTFAWVPVLLFIQTAFTLGVTLAVSAAVVYLRDIRHVLPLALQVGLFATPVAFGITAVPRAWTHAYVAVNPLAGVIDGYRTTLLMGEAPKLDLIAIAAIVSIAVLLGGYAFFKRLEGGFADVA